MSKRFVKSLDVSARIGNLLGAGVQRGGRARGGRRRPRDPPGRGRRAGRRIRAAASPRWAGSRWGCCRCPRASASGRARRWRRSRATAARAQQLKMQMIFQDPYASLNPRMRVVDIVGEAPVAHGMVAAAATGRNTSRCSLNRVGLDPALMRRFPHQFSGGQRARIGIARALAVKPEFLVCDESVAALDVSIQAQVLNLFMDLQVGAQPHLSLHQPRPRRGRAHQRPRRHHVPGPRGRVGTDRRALRRAEPSLHAGAAGRRRARSSRASARSCRSRARFRRRSRRPGLPFPPRCPHAMARCRTTAPRAARDRAGRWSACHLNDARVVSDDSAASCATRREAPRCRSCSIRRTRGEHYPDDFDHVPPRAVVRQAEDTHVARLYRAATRVGATLIEATFPARLHRRRTAASPTSIRRCSPTPGRDPLAPSRKTEQGIGLVWRIARGGAPMYDRKLTAAEVRRRIDRCYLPYHAALRRRSTRCIARSAPCGTSTAIRCRRSATRMPTIRGASAPTSCSATATARRASPHSRDWSPRRVRGMGYTRRDERSLQGRRARPEARAAGRAPAQPADRDQAHAVHGRGDARAERGLCPARARPRAAAGDLAAFVRAPGGA